MTFFIATIIILFSQPPFAKQQERPYILVTIEPYENIPAYKELTEFIKVVLKNSNLDVNVTEAPLARGIELVNSGKADFLIVGLDSLKDSHKNLVPTSFPYMKPPMRVFFNTDDSGKFKSGNSLKDLEGVVLLNASFLLNNHYDLKVTQVSSIKHGLQMVVNKRVDYLLAIGPAVQGIIDQAPAEYTKIGSTNRDDIKLFFYFWTNRRNSVLLPSIEKNLKKAIHESNPKEFKYIWSSLLKNDEKVVPVL